jgi:hypothetical protein
MDATPIGLTQMPSTCAITKQLNFSLLPTMFSALKTTLFHSGSGFKSRNTTYSLIPADTLSALPRHLLNSRLTKKLMTSSVRYTPPIASRALDGSLSVKAGSSVAWNTRYHARYLPSRRAAQATANDLAAPTIFGD